MFVLVYPADGFGRGQPIRLAASQVLVCQNNGTPIAIAADYGPQGAQAVAKVGDEDFNRTLRDLGVPITVLHDDIVMPPPPPGARLVAGPRPSTKAPAPVNKKGILHG